MVETRNQKRKSTEEIFAVIKKKKKQIDLDSVIESEIQQESESEIEFEDQEIDTESESLEIELNDELENNQLQLQEPANNVNHEIVNVIQSLSKIYNEFQLFLQQKMLQDNNSEESDPDYDPVFGKFNEILESIFSSEFFERLNYNDKLKQLSFKEIEFFTNELIKIQSHYKNGPNIIDIIKLNVPIEQKRHLLEVVHHLENCDTLSQEYTTNLRYLENSIKEATRDPELIELEQRIQQKALSNKQDNYKTKILKSQMSFDNKIIAYQKLEIMESYEHGHSDEFIKYKNWMDTLLNIPFGIYNNIPVNINTSSHQEIGSYIRSVRNTLDSQLSFLEKPKDQIINIVTQMIRNPDCNINAIGLYGSKGLGKTELAFSIAKALNRPLRTISLGGESDSSNLTGHNFTYVGSQAGRFIEILKETQTMTPIILLDECFPYYQKIITENGPMNIGKLYHDFKNNNQVPKIKSFNNVTQEFEYKNITNVWEKNNENLIELNIGGYTTKCTENHLFLTENGYIPAKNLTNKDNILSQPSRFSSKKLNDDQYQIVLGSFLGDGHIYKLKSNKIGLSVRHGIEQKEYCEWKAKIFDVDTKIIEKNGYSQNQAIMFDTKIIHITKEFPLSKTSCPQWLIDDLDWRGIAIWIMDDGSITKKGGYGTFKISTDSFDIDSQIRLVKKLNDLGIECSFIKYKKIYYRIDLTANGCKNLIVNIFPYIHSSMMYKILTKDLQSRFKLKNDTYWSFSEITQPIINKIYNVWSCTSQKIVNYKYNYCKKCNTNTYSILNKNKNCYQCYHKEIRNDNLHLIKKLQPYVWDLTNYKYNLINLQSKKYIKNITTRYKKYNNKVYDIEIEDNHNFLITSNTETSKYNTNNIGIIVHNCDKISVTEKANEIIGTLIHLTDSTTNNKYNIDKYFSGVEFDLSKVLFIFTYNDPTKIDKILSDRLYKIKVDNYNFKEKLEIVNKHLINNILNKLQLSESISFSQEAIEHLVRESQKDEGLRTIKTKIKIILTRINMLLLTNKDDNIIKLKYNKLYNYYKTLPLIIPKEHIDIFLDESISSELESSNPPFGMYI